MDIKKRISVVFTAVALVLTISILTERGVMSVLWDAYGVWTIIVLIIVGSLAYGSYRFIMAGSNAKEHRLIDKGARYEADVLRVVTETISTPECFFVESELIVGKAVKTLYRVHCQHCDTLHRWDFYSDYVLWDPAQYISDKINVYVNPLDAKDYHVALEQLKDN